MADILQDSPKVKNVRTHTCIYLIVLFLARCSPVVEDTYIDSDLFTDSGMLLPVSRSIDTVPIISGSSGDLEAYQYGTTIETKNISPASLVSFAQTLVGTPYKYGSSNPKVGFDCSGFITYVFNHFDIAVPRSSVDFTDVGEMVPPKDAKPGDLILFTGTDSLIKKVGHLGIVTFNSVDTLLFIHSTSGKLHSVTVTPLSDYYRTRFIKIVRIFKNSNKPSAKR